MIEAVKKVNNVKELSYLNKEDLSFFKEILEADTSAGKEHLIKDILLTKLKSLNFNVSVDEHGNIAAVRGEADQYPLLNAHMDIVETRGGYSTRSYYGYGNYTGLNDFSSYGFEEEEEELSFVEKESVKEELLESLGSYAQDEDFYREVYDILEDCTNKDISLKDTVDFVTPYIKNLDYTELEYIGYDCKYCSYTCKCSNICDSFKLTEDNAASETLVSKLLEHSESALTAYEEYENMVNLALKEKVASKNKSDKKKQATYSVNIDLSKNKIEGTGKPRILGGDDKCGIMISLKVAEILSDMPMKILFTVAEEYGCVGVRKFITSNRSWFDDVIYSLTIDRKEGNHLLWSQLGTRSCNNEFAAKLAREGVKEGIQVKLMDGSVADVIHIRDIVPNSVNMSAGYYNAHTNSEYIRPYEVDSIIGWVKNILLNV